MSFRNRFRRNKTQPESVAAAASDSKFHMEQQTLQAIETHKSLVDSIDQKKKDLKVIEKQIQDAIIEIDSLNESLDKSKESVIEFTTAVQQAEADAIKAEKELEALRKDIESKKIDSLQSLDEFNAAISEKMKEAEENLCSSLLLVDEARTALDQAISQCKEKNDEIITLNQTIASKEKEVADIQSRIDSIIPTLNDLEAKRFESSELDIEISNKKSELQQIFTSIQKGEEELKSFLEQTMAANAVSDEKIRNIKAVENSVDKKIAIIKQFLDKADVTDTIKSKIINL